jgi:hypothetical protein
MEPIAPDAEREERIHDEIVVDAYGPEERAVGWYCYLADRLLFPFEATCVNTRITSPLSPGQKVDVMRLAPEEVCEREIMVLIRWNADALTVPLAQLNCVAVEEETQQGIEDWHCWTARGYRF